MRIRSVLSVRHGRAGRVLKTGQSCGDPIGGTTKSSGASGIKLFCALAEGEETSTGESFTALTKAGVVGKATVDGVEIRAAAAEL
jgi:hypothetical protein